MLFEIVSTTVFGAIAIKAYTSKKGLSNDSGKIQRIMSLSGLNVKDGEDTHTTQLIKKKQYYWGWEYRYRIPLGRSFDDYASKLRVLEDGLNNRRKRITFADLKSLQLDANIIDNLRTLWKTKLTERKEIELAYDGLLIVRVYDKALPTQINWNDALLKSNTWSVPIGFTRNGETIRHDFDKDKHLIIAGATGFGKSAILKLITTMLIEQQPENVELSLIDLKGGSAFHRFRNCKQVKYYSRDPKSAMDVLTKVQNDMQKSFEHVVDSGFEDVKEAKIKKRHFIIIDEAADLSDDKDVMEIITDIARRGRSAGYYLIFCTQYPTAQVIPSQTKRNIIARLCYVVDTDTASRVVLDECGADKLPDIPGRGIYKNNVKRYTVQSPFISNQTIQQIIEPHIVKEESSHEKEDSDEARRTDSITFETL
ncbi:FtsK/SpoIIIE domain-containing protein [Lysinibacillus antri]|uniref:Cell division protein FtsK n=1 Tax=Lysinibacillus antri TaxID=2498145 RepID=A0A432LAA2_9BACI|nr:FtsK/SpoIIIE domain-containing protein [Lysinibacillus antri]RUL51118.1 cell division protein FtsK [Lysinibacillus antri]